MDPPTDPREQKAREFASQLTHLLNAAADKLFISAKTVEAHREHIKEKLGLKSSAELLRFAIRNTPDE